MQDGIEAVTYDNGEEAELCGKVHRRIALVQIVWVAQDVGVVFGDALDEEEVVEVDCSLEADGGIDHDIFVDMAIVLRSGKPSFSCESHLVVR